ncbi:hypothetical protein [Bradyrhizobium sp. HKCCYLS3013]|uniref:hypothetical protein n=1 Tax=Bradyrhizobium sp. HKCCYLS3013 TaxID=3420735 RepID=UPI003EBE30B6
MSKGVHNFRQSDVTKAIKAAVKSGANCHVEIVKGKIVIIPGKTDVPEKAAPSSEWD